MYEFRWNDWNLDHIAIHGIEPEEAAYVVRRARSPYPERLKHDTLLVRGQTESGSYIQVAFHRR